MLDTNAPQYKLVNTVVSTRIKQSLDIDELALFLQNTQFNPKTFPGLVIRRKTVGATLIVFSTGRFVSIASNENRCLTALEVVAKEISSVKGKSVSYDCPRVENIVATMDFETNIDLEGLSEREGCIYEPEQFPAAICHLDNSVVLLVFQSGKVNCVGAKSEEEIIKAIRWLQQKLKI